MSILPFPPSESISPSALRLHVADDWHLHLRDDALLKAVVPFSAAHFARALIMPNLDPPITDLAAAIAYRARILACLPPQTVFEPLMTLYLTSATSVAMIRDAAASDIIVAVKLYPAGATTNSCHGVADLAPLMPVFAAMAETGLTLCIHAESADPEVDIFDRERVFIERALEPLRRRVPGLRVVLEHVTTAEGIAYVREGGDDIAATITAHHLVLNRNHLLAGGIRPHYYCLPVAKRESHRRALCAAAVSGDAHFFFGSDSAPHYDGAKLAPIGCAGCFTAPVALAIVATVFEEAGALDRLDGFLSEYGARFYRQPRNEQTYLLTKTAEPMAIPKPVAIADRQVTIFDSGQALSWHIDALAERPREAVSSS